MTEPAHIIRTVRVTNFELVRVLEGNAVRFRADDGSLVDIRLSTVQELIADVQEAQRALPPELRQAMPRAQAEALTRPVKLP